MHLRNFVYKFFVITFALLLLLSGFDEGYFAYAASFVFPNQLDTLKQYSPEASTSQPKIPPLKLQSPERSPIPRSIDNLQFKLNGIKFEGNTFYSNDDLKFFYQDMLGKAVVLEDIRKIADSVEERYKKNGYFLTRVFLPPQQVDNGIFTLKVVEGYIGEILIEGGTEEVRNKVYSNFLPLLMKKPIDLPSVEKALLLLNDYPGIQGSGLLRAGRELGASDLLIQLETLPVLKTLSINNQNSNAIGPVVSTFAIQFRSVLKYFDELTLQASSSADFQKLKTVLWRYALPIGSNGLVISASGLNSSVKPGGEFKDLNLENKILANNLKLKYPLIRTREGSLYLESGVGIVNSDSLKDSVSYDSKKYTVKDLSLQAVEVQSPLGVTQFSAGISQAEDKSTIPTGVPVAKKSIASLRHTASLSANLFVQLEVQSQSSKQQQPVPERISFGGANIGRGFDPSSLVGDKGTGATLELGWNGRVTSPWGTDGLVQAFVFRDQAQATLIDGISDTKKLSSSGLGLRWQSPDGMKTSLYVAKPDKNQDFPNEIKPKLFLNVSVPW